MKIAEIREIANNELAERIEAEVANYNQMVLNLSLIHIFHVLKDVAFVFVCILLLRKSRIQHCVKLLVCV